MLHTAVESKYTHMIPIWVKYGVNINTKDADGHTALSIARTTKNTEAERELMQCGAEL